MLLEQNAIQRERRQLQQHELCDQSTWRKSGACAGAWLAAGEGVWARLNPHIRETSKDFQDFDGLSRTSKGLPGLLWTSRDFQGTSRISTDLQGLPRTCKDSQRKSLGNNWNEILENRQPFLGNVYGEFLK